MSREVSRYQKERLHWVFSAAPMQDRPTGCACSTRYTHLFAHPYTKNWGPRTPIHQELGSLHSALHSTHPVSMSVPLVPIDPHTVPELQEQQYVHDVYNEIALHFSQTRYKPWPIVERFLKAQPDYAVGIDVGCGNGKYLCINPKLTLIGLDRSHGLVACAQENSRNQSLLAVADGLHLPHPSGRFDFAISIAVIHHFASEDRRIDAIRHILLKLRPGAPLLVYCWALEQATSRRGYKEGDDQDILIPWVLNRGVNRKKGRGKGQQILTGENEKNGGNGAIGRNEAAEGTNEGEAQGHAEVAEDVKKDQTETKYRYYHLYKEGELTANAVSAGGRVLDSGYEKDNWWAIIARPETS